MYDHPACGPMVSTLMFCISFLVIVRPEVPGHVSLLFQAISMHFPRSRLSYTFILVVKAANAGNANDLPR